MQDKKDKKLTTEQWNLLNYLKSKGKTDINTIIYDLGKQNGYVLNSNPKTHDPCIQLRHDADAITNSRETDKIVVHDRYYNFWVADNKEETAEWAKKTFLIPAITKLKKYHLITGLLKLDGQGRLVDLKGNVINEESLARPFVETILKRDET